MTSEFVRYWSALCIFRFFYRQPYIYLPVARELLGKYFKKSKFSPPRNIVLKLTSRCNAKCKFCYAQKDSKESARELSFEEWTDLIDQAYAMGCYTVTLSGGEPLLWPRLVELIEYISRKRMLVFTTTNGIATSLKRLRELESAGLCALNFSLHGPREEHDRVVGISGAFDRCMKNLCDCANKTRIISIANHVLTRDSVNYGWHQEVWSRAHDAGARAFNVLPICANSTDTSNLLDETGGRVLEDLAKNPWVLMDTKNYASPRCPAGRDDLFVNNYGEVQPCPFIPITFGNVRMMRLEDILLRIQHHEMFAEESPICMPARDKRFIEKYIVPAFRHEKLPTPIDFIQQELTGSPDGCG